MIDSNAFDIVMPYEMMKVFRLKVDPTQGRCCAMDKREVTIIGNN